MYCMCTYPHVQVQYMYTECETLLLLPLRQLVVVHYTVHVQYVYVDTMCALHIVCIHVYE